VAGGISKLAGKLGNNRKTICRKSQVECIYLLEQEFMGKGTTDMKKNRIISVLSVLEV
jgi:hypothetical protein